MARVLIGNVKGEKGDSSIFPGSSAHNAVYRGKYLGSAATDAQYRTIAIGEFEDLYIGDYWTIKGVTYLIAGFNYFAGVGDPPWYNSHAVIIPKAPMYTARMSPMNVGGAYVSTEMYTTNLNQAKETIKAAFSGHVKTHKVMLTNGVSDGYTSSVIWTNSEVNLMSQMMVCGCNVVRNHKDGSIYRQSEKAQLPLFALNQLPSNSTVSYYLRDNTGGVRYGLCSSGCVHSFDGHDTRGVLPYFCIG